MKFIITVDVEADNFWKRDSEITLDNIKHLPRFQALCEKYSFKPTYLVSYEVANNQYSVNIIKPWLDNDKAEIGAHPHVWTTPPYKKDFDWETKHHRFWHELDDNELDEKLRSITEIITKNFGRTPTSFRAGRWCLDGRALRILEKLGYIADSSVTPKINWRMTKGDPDKNGGVDYRFAPNTVYHPSYENIIKAGECKILEIPMTILYTKNYFAESSWPANKYLDMNNVIIKNIVSKLFFGQKWLRIFPNTAINDIKNIYVTAQNLGLPYIQFMIHSSELKAGSSPYVQNKTQLEHVYEILDQSLRYFNENKLESATLSEFAKDNK